MPLSARELVLVLRARDEASRSIQTVGNNIRTLGDDTKSTAQKMAAIGSGLLTTGTLLAGAGAVGTGFFNSATDSAMDYNKAAALTYTQAKNTGASLEQIKKIGLDVANDVPVAFTDIQDALFDIFSTVNTNAPEAQMLLEQFGKAAVAGDANIRDVSRTTMAVMNAYGRPASDVNKILDTQFKLVQLGAGTYQEFTDSIGLNIPTAKAAGQSFETLSGAMAFLTRQGVQIPNATAAVGRAMELMALPKTQAALERAGVTIKDTNGNFLQMDDIITQLAVNKGWAKMTDPERKKAFEDIFGKGTIQARRFFDVAIPNYEQFNALTDEVRNGQGSMEDAYAIMFDQPANKAALLKNQYEALKVEIGDQLIPAKVKLMEKISELIGWWNGLDEGTRNTIIKIAAIAAVIVTVIGTIMAIVGAVLMFMAALSMANVSLTALAAGFGWFLLIAALVAGAAYLIYKNWDTVGPILKAAWDTIKNAVSDAWNFISPIIDEIIAGFKDFWDTLMNPGEGITDSGFPGVMQRLALFLANDVWPAVQTAWDALRSFAEWFANDAWPKIADAVQWTWDKLKAFWDWLTNSAVPTIVDFGQQVVDAFQWLWDKAVEAYNWFNDTFGPGFQKIWDSLKENIPPIIDELKETWDSIKTKVQEVYDAVAPILDDLWTKWEEIHDKIMDKVEEVWDAIEPYISPVLDSLKTIIGDWITWLTTNWGIVWDLVSTQVSIAWNVISTIIASGIAIISNIIQLFLNILQGDWGEAWNNVKSILSNTWEIIKTLISGAVQTVMNLISNLMAVVTNTMSAGWNMMVSLVRAAFGQFLSTISSSVQSALSTIGRIPGQIQSIFSGAGSWLVNAGKAIVDGLIGGIGSKFQSLKNKLSELTGLIPSWKGPEDVDKKLLFSAGTSIMGGLQSGLESGWSGVRGYLNGLTTSANFTPSINLGAEGRQPTNDNQLLRVMERIADAIEKLEPGVKVENLEVTPDTTMDELWYKAQFSGA